MPTIDKSLPTRLERLARLARLRLIWERYIGVLAVPFLALGLFLIMTWLGLWEIIADPVRILALIITAGLMGRGILKARHFKWPSRSDALRRLETTAGLAHRPLDTLKDKPVLSPDLWPRHLQDAQEQSLTIRKVGRRPILSPMDRYGLRFLLPIGIILALFLSFGLSLERLRHALSPSLHSPTNPYTLTFEAWVDPPDYTGRPPIYAQGEGAIKAPVGSTLVVRASGASTLPRPRFISEQGQRFLELNTLGRNSVEVRTIIDGSGRLDWRIGPFRQVYQIDASPDAPPQIETLDPPEADKRDRLVLTFQASDDYGVEEVLLQLVELTEGLSEQTAFENDPWEIDTRAGGFTQTDRQSVKLDLTRHPLAGRKVMARLVAIDGADQRGVSIPFYTTIPDKIFVEPLAKAIIEQRSLLLSAKEDYRPAPSGKPDNDASDGSFDTFQTAWRLGRAPEPVQRTVDLIEAITDRPDPSLFNDPVIYMGLRHVGKTLRYARSDTALEGLPDHMWKLGIRAEFGVLGTALQEMQDAQQALREGIARRAPQREIDTLFERYNQAVDAYMEELRKNATIGDPSQGGGDAPPLGSTDEIQALLDAIEEANRTGDTEGARRALAQLAELLENMQMQITPGGGGSGDEIPEDQMSEEMREALEELADTLGEQRDLQDQTRQAERDEFRQQFGREPDEGAPSAEDLAEQQAGIESLLEGLRDELDNNGLLGEEEGGDSAPGEGNENGSGADGTPSSDGGAGGTSSETEQGGGGSATDALERAIDSMQQSEEALAREDFSGSRQAQSEAIRALRDAGDAIAQAIADRRAEQQGEAGTDPLGRGLDGLDSDNAESDIDTPDNAERSREILEELRRRASEAERDQQEQDYLDRLLDRF